MTDNPFLLPPGGASPRQPDPAEPTPTPPAAPTPPARTPDGYIAVPPSVESATHRIARPPAPPLVEPVETPPVDPLPADSRPADPLPAEASVAEETRLSPLPTRAPTLTQACTLVLPDGTHLPVEGPVLLGRDPAPIADRPGARLLPLDDAGKTVSKTHALFEPSGGGIRIQDLHSTNGVAITQGGVRTVMPPGADGIALPGAIVELGSVMIVVSASTGPTTDPYHSAVTT